MTRLAISVEGKTEREFVQRLLAGHLLTRGVVATAILIGRAGGESAGGGGVSVDRLAGEMRELLRSFDAVTSLVDFYGFQRKGDATVTGLEEQVRRRVADRVRAAELVRRAFPYIQLHEFEALLFSEVGGFAVLEDLPKDAIEALRRVRSQFATPEDIDDGRDTAPSKRILSAIPNYQKGYRGYEIAQEIGLPKIRAECRRFDRWIQRLESLGAGSAVAGEERL